MAGAGSGAGTAGSRGWLWDVVLSFAGAQRDYVGQVAAALKAQGVRCFYDADEQVELWGRHLPEELPAIYGERAAAVVVFISAEYAARDWTRLERRAALDRAVRERREYVLPARFDDTPLPGLLPGTVTVDLRTRTPQQFAGLIAAKLAALGITGPADDRAGRPAGAVHASQADLRRLGVHAAISVPGVTDDVPPEYVLRDADSDEHGVRAAVAAAAQRGGFVLLVGGSSAGKTRCAAETVKALLPDWWLVHPGDPGEVAALAAAPPPHTVVWLDELQKYLDGESGLAGGTVRALLSGPGPVLLIGTLWPDRYHAYTAVPMPGGRDQRAREREMLGLATVIRIREEFSLAEQDRARSAAVQDARLAAALDTEGYGLTQTLTAAPQLMARWQDGRAANPYGWAVLAAALDVARLGGRAPLSAGLLQAAAPGYCTSTQEAEAPSDWFEQALAYATEKLHGAAAALAPAGAGVMGQVAGYTVADYLLQHASRERRMARIPASTWDAILTRIHDPGDAARLARSAKGRLLYRYAIPLYRRAADAGSQSASRQLARLLAERGDLDEAVQILLVRGDGMKGDPDRGLSRRLARLLAERGDLDQLRILADAGRGAAAHQLARLLAERGDLDELRARAAAGDRSAAGQLDDLLAGRKDPDNTEELFRAIFNAGDPSDAGHLTDLLAKLGDLDQLRARADIGDRDAARQLADLLVNHGDLDGAEQFLRARVESGEGDADRLAEVLAQQGQEEDARRLRKFGMNPDGSIACE